MNIKKILLIGGFILVVVIIALGLFYVFYRPAVIPPGGNGTNAGNLPGINAGNIPVVTPGGNAPVGFPDTTRIDQVASGGLTEVTDYDAGQVIAPKATAGGILYYDADSSRFISIDSDGVKHSASDPIFYGVSNITWSPTKNQAILEYPDGANIVYDLGTKQQVSLPKELQQFSFDPSGTKLAAVWKGDTKDNQWLTTSNVDGSNLKLVEQISGSNALNLQVGISPDNQVIGLYGKVVGSDQLEVYPLGRNGENFDSFTVDGLKFASKWSPPGNYLLFNASNAADGYRPRLWLTEGDTDSLGYSQTDLGLQTWADKCTFDRGGSQVYCAVPQELAEGSGLYPGLADSVPDAFYRIDLTSGMKIPLAIPVGSENIYNASSLSLSADESVLYFTDRISQRLHSIKLK